MICIEERFPTSQELGIICKLLPRAQRPSGERPEALTQEENGLSYGQQTLTTSVLLVLEEKRKRSEFRSCTQHATAVVLVMNSANGNYIVTMVVTVQPQPLYTNALWHDSSIASPRKTDQKLRECCANYLDYFLGNSTGRIQNQIQSSFLLFPEI